MTHCKRYGMFMFGMILIFMVCGLIYKGIVNAGAIFGAGCAAMVGVSFCTFSPIKAQAVRSWMIRYRWLVAGAVFLSCILLRLHGSSIGMYNAYFPTMIEPDNSMLFGAPRGIRSDEWAVQTPTFFSQYYNQHRLFSNQMSMSGMNMLLDYYSPVADIVAIGKPQLWGYLLFGNEVGLSWNWCSLILFVFMGSFELFWILSKHNGWIAVIGMLMVGLSPAIQWWVMPHMPIVFAYAMLLYCAGYYFFTARFFAGKLFFAASAGILCVGFVVSIFPSCQIPCVLITIGLLAATLIRDREKISFQKKDAVLLGGAACFVVGVLVYFAWISREDLSALMNTAYPGKRVSLGGGYRVYDLFADLYSMYLPYKDSNIHNNCEVATYLHFVPFFLPLYLRIRKTLKEKNRSALWIGDFLMAVLIVEIVFMLVGFPQWLAKLTLFSYINRMKIVFGWTGTIFTCYGFYLLLLEPNALKQWEKLLYPVMYAVSYLFFVNETMKSYLPAVVLIGELVLFAAVLFAAEYRYKPVLFGLVAAMMTLSGGVVNPISTGTSAITNHPIYDTVSSIVESEPDARWMVFDTDFTTPNYFMACGAKVINATQFLPDLRKWEIIDPNARYTFETNRYSNQCATLTDKTSEVQLLHPDSIRIVLNPSVLKELDIRYMVSTVDYSELLDQYGIEASVAGDRIIIGSIG